MYREMMKDIKSSISKFQQDALEYKALFQDNCEMVSRFDEVLTTKAQKVTVMEMDKLLSAKIELTKEFLMEQLCTAEAERNEYRAQFDSFCEVMN